jgi:hypothetical protein
MKSKSIKRNMSIKIKKELEKLTKEWLQGLSKKTQSKKSINKFINSIKKKCNHSVKKRKS